MLDKRYEHILIGIWLEKIFARFYPVGIFMNFCVRIEEFIAKEASKIKVQIKIFNWKKKCENFT